MNNNSILNSILNEHGFHLEDIKASLTDDEYYSTDDDYYQLSDNRTWKSNVEDIQGGDNFAEYCEYFYELLDEEEYFDN